VEGFTEIVGAADTVGKLEGASVGLVEGTSVGDTVAKSASKRMERVRTCIFTLLKRTRDKIYNTRTYVQTMETETEMDSELLWERLMAESKVLIRIETKFIA
jgi:hypothetical protein